MATLSSTFVASQTQAAEPPTFARTEHSSTNGSVQLRWDDVGGTYEVELRSNDAPSRTIYRGPLPSAHISGLADGEYEAFVRAQDLQGIWSEVSAPAHIRVAHHSMGTVWLLVATGALTFFTTALTLVVSSRRSAS